MRIIYLSLFLSLFATGIKAQFSTRQDIDISNIKAGHFVHGDFWGDFDQYMPACEYPKNSGKHAAFVSSLWLGGFVNSTEPRVSGLLDKSWGVDFWPGPVGNDLLVPGTNADAQKWAKIWKLNRKTLDSFRHLSIHTIANTPAVILEWPAKGNVNAKGNNGAALAISKDLAPFVDADHDGVYNALNGDYPIMKGDQMLWWVLNDHGPSHNATGGPTQGMSLEVQVMAYAYKLDNMNYSLNNVIYYEFNLQNRFNQRIDSMILGINSNSGIGYGFDDFVGFDSATRMAIAYNGNSVDGSGQSFSYGTSIPVRGVAFMELPGDNGNATTPAGSFIRYNNDFTASGNPTTTQHFYYYLSGSFKDGVHLVNDWDGVAGHASSGRGIGSPTNYIYSGDPAVSNQWSECNSSNLVGDRKFVLSSNAFTLMPFSSRKIAMALVITPLGATGCPHTSFATVKDLASDAQYYYNHPLYLPTSVSSQQATISTIKLFPNPATDFITITGSSKTIDPESVSFYNATGSKLSLPYTRVAEGIQFNIATLPAGMYNFVYSDNGYTEAARFVKQ